MLRTRGGASGQPIQSGANQAMLARIASEPSVLVARSAVARSPLPSSAIPAVSAAAAAAARRRRVRKERIRQPDRQPADRDGVGDPDRGQREQTNAIAQHCPSCRHPVSVAPRSGRLIVDNTNGVAHDGRAATDAPVIRSSYGRAAGPSVTRGDGSWNAPPEELPRQMLLIALLVSACGAGGGSSTRPSAPATRPAVVQRPF